MDFCRKSEAKGISSQLDLPEDLVGPKGFNEDTQAVGCLAQDLSPPDSSILLMAERPATCLGLPTPNPPLHHDFHGWTHLGELQVPL